MKLTTKICALLLTVFMTSVAVAQDKKPASPQAHAKGQINGADISISYSSPFVKGRTIWGELVPYGKIWRAGANAPTTLGTNKAITIEGKELPAGKYAIYVIPENGKATVIFGKDINMGAHNYDQSTEQLRVTVPTKKSSKMNESLVYTVGNDNITLSWENLDIPLSVK